MKIKNNLRLRFVASFVIYTMLIAGVFATLIIHQERKIAEEFFLRRITSEIEYFSERFERNPKTPLPVSNDIRAYLGTEEMPPIVRDVIKEKMDGVYFEEIDDDKLFKNTKAQFAQDRRWRGNDELFFGIKTLADGQKLIIFIDFEYWFEKEHELMAHSFWAYFVALVCAILIGFKAAHHIINPLNRLMGVINESDPGNIPSGFSKMFKNDEFGALARALEDSLVRVKKFIKREHQFTRDASHELRTPVTVIKGAVELLNMTPVCEDKMVDKLVKRIERSAVDMETTIESLLWLARESVEGGHQSPAELLPLVENAIEQNRHLITGKPVAIELKVEETPIISAPAGVLAIAVSNLIRNACQFTVKGVITVTLKQHQIDVEDTGVGIAEETLGEITKPEVSSYESKGFGFGLDIVSRLCSRFGWRLEIDSKPGQGTKTSLIFE